MEGGKPRYCSWYAAKASAFLDLREDFPRLGGMCARAVASLDAWASSKLGAADGLLQPISIAVARLSTSCLIVFLAPREYNWVANLAFVAMAREAAGVFAGAFFVEDVHLSCAH